MDDNNNVYYEVAMGESYRNLLLEHGISYNVQIFIKAIYYGAGEIALTPDAEFAQCMETDDWLLLGRALSVAASDDETFFIAPYANWINDSVRYIWHGTDSATVFLGTTCEFDPTDGTDERIVDVMGMKAGGDTAIHTNADIAYYMTYMNNPDNTAKGGIFFIKVLSTSPGTLKAEHIPVPPPEGDAELLKYDQITNVDANSTTSKLYAIPSSWTKATLFSVPTDHIFRMYIGTTHDFFLDEAIATYQFRAGDDGHRLGLAETEMQELWTNTQDKYLYIRFECTAKTTIVPSEWIMSQCEEATREIKRPSTTLMVEKGSYKIVYYRLYYREWKGGDMTFEWQSEFSKCPTFIGDTCKFTLNGSAPHVIDNMEIDELGSWTIPAVDLADYENEVDEDGYLYVRFNPGYQGTMVVSTTAPEEQDPEPVVYPAATISVSCDGEPTAEGQTFTVRVSQEQDLRLDGGDQWHQTPDETHLMTLPSGIHMLVGEEQSVRIEVK